MKTIACIAHDRKKQDMISLVCQNSEAFKRVNVVATGTTGSMIMEHTPVKSVRCMKSGPLGGDAQIAAMIVTEEVHAVIFLVDPLDVHPHQVDVSMLLRNLQRAQHTASDEHGVGGDTPKAHRRAGVERKKTREE